jgi:hypothetical protein
MRRFESSRQQEMTLADHSQKNAAHHQFKVQKADDARKAMSEYEANAAAVLAKTERLKALRLAKEAAEGKAPKKKAASAKKKNATPGKEKGPDLAEWLKSRQGAGWRS